MLIKCVLELSQAFYKLTAHKHTCIPTKLIFQKTPTCSFQPFPTIFPSVSSSQILLLCWLCSAPDTKDGILFCCSEWQEDVLRKPQTRNTARLTE